MEQAQKDLAQRLYRAVLNYKAATHVYVHIFTPEQWQVVSNAYDAVIALHHELDALQSPRSA